MLHKLAFVNEEDLTNAVERALQTARDTLEADLPEVFTGDTSIKAKVTLAISNATGSSNRAVYTFTGCIIVTEDKGPS